MLSGGEVYVVTQGHRLSRDQCARLVSDASDQRDDGGGQAGGAVKRRHIDNQAHARRQALDQRHRRAATSQSPSLPTL